MHAVYLLHLKYSTIASSYLLANSTVRLMEARRLLVGEQHKEGRVRMMEARRLLKSQD